MGGMVDHDCLDFLYGRNGWPSPFRLSLWVEWLAITIYTFFMGGMVGHHRLDFLYGWNG
jgi:hypothetical protein